ncbi:ferritin-like domain-containing protein [Ruminococcaceae bacterium OttesenSCG-928-N02]|nr:ferritin-like domain-containing protein [Ruminococcaceae bacterium OttesenSCG-928-N02]
MQSISAKELTFLQDQLANEQLMVKKYTMYAQQVGDAALKKKCKSIAQKHQDHYDKLFKHLS